MLKDKNEEEIGKVVQMFFEAGDKSTHGLSIGPDKARKFGLNIKKEDKYGEFWSEIWEIYVKVELYTSNKGLAKYILARNGGIEVQVRPFN